MGYFQICRVGYPQRQHDRRSKRSRHQTDIHEFSSLTETLPEKPSRIIFAAQPPTRDFFEDS
jgi:hypothetical protein